MVNETVVSTVASSAESVNTILSGGIVGNIILAVVILLIGFVIGSIVGKVVTKILSAVEIDMFIKKTGIKIQLESFLGRVASYLVYFLVVLMALDQIGVKVIVLQVLAVALLVLLLLSLILSVRDFLPNFFAGAFAVKGKLLGVGDRLRIHGVEGRVERLGVVNVRMKTKKGDVIFIPYSNLVRSDFAVKRKK